MNVNLNLEYTASPAEINAFGESVRPANLMAGDLVELGNELQFNNCVGFIGRDD